MKKLFQLLILSLLMSFNSAIAQNYLMSSSTTYTTCSGNFYDGGGSSGDYPNNQNVTVTFYPATVGAKLSVTFNSFRSQVQYYTCSSTPADDILYVYNGNSIAAPQIGSMQGVGYGTVTSTASDGSITFRFVSSAACSVPPSGTRAGWSATISCSPTPPNDITMIAGTAFVTCGGNFYDAGGPTGDYMNNQNSTLTLYPATAGAKVSVTFNAFHTQTQYYTCSSNPSDDILFVYNGNSTAATQIGALQGQAGYGTITSTAADGSLTFKFVSSASCSVPSSGTRAGWAATISCSPTPPNDITMIAGTAFVTCGGNFYDAGGPSGDYMNDQNSTLTLYPATAGAKVSVTFNSFHTQTQYYTCSSDPSDDILFVYNGNSTAATQIGALQGQAGYGTITSTAADGSLTFKFVSSASCSVPASGTRAGWAATISCSPIPPNDITMIAGTAFVTCGGNFYDAGGPSGDYMNDQNSTLTLYPSCNYNKVSVSFNSFHTQIQYYTCSSALSDDILYVYNGPSTFSPLITAISGSAIPGIINSTAIDGSLTFKFVSSASCSVPAGGTRAGWAATISCLCTSAIGGTAIAAQPSICAGGTSLLTVSGHEGCDIQWQSSTDNIVYTNIIGATNVSYSTPALSATTYYRANISKGGSCADAYSTVATVTVNPIPSVNSISSQTKCNGTNTTTINFTGAILGTTYNWTNSTSSIGLAGSGSGNIASFAAINNGTTPAIATITVTPTLNGCTGNSMTATITVNPTPTINSISNQARCNGANTAVINFTGAVIGTSYNWTNSNPSIGLVASGAGNIASFIATNTSVLPITATITVMPVVNSCNGNSTTTVITVNPIPTVNGISSQTKCNGANTTTINFAGAVFGASYNWTNSASTIGLAGNGTGDIASFAAINNGITPTIATITVTPTLNSCTGNSTTATITVNPTPTVNSISNQTRCNGTNTAVINYTGAVTGTTYNWTNSNISIGLGISGAGNIASFVTSNTSASPITATITVTPVANSCTGNSAASTITVNPTPTVTSSGNKTICSGDTVTIHAYGGVSYSWSPVTGLDNSTIANPIASPTSTQIYIVTVTGANSCTSSDSLLVTVNPLPTIPSISGNISICEGSNSTLSVSNPCPNCIYNWSNGMTGQSILVDSALNYTATATNNCGISASSNNLTIVVHTPIKPTINATGITTFCQGGSVTLFSNSALNNVWSNSATTQFINVSTTGDYFVTVTDVNNCPANSDTIPVTVNPLPNANITPNGPTSFCQGGSVILISGSSSGNHWSTNDSTQFITVITSGNYSLTVTDTNNCSANSALTIMVNPFPDTSTSQSNFGITLNSNESGAIYQWLQNCLTTPMLLVGYTSQSYTANVNGYYSVIVTKNGCTDTSACIWVGSVGITTNEGNSLIQFFPNPAKDKLYFKNRELKESTWVTIENIIGERVLEGELKENEINIVALLPALYIIKVKSKEGISVGKFLKE